MPKSLTEQYQLWMEAGATFADVRNRIDKDYTDQERGPKKPSDLDSWIERNARLRRRETSARNPEQAGMTARKKGAAIGLTKEPSRLAKLMHNIQQKTRRPWADVDAVEKAKKER